MPAQKQDKREGDKEARELPRVLDILGKQVLHALGQPGNLHQVQVRHLWSNHYRANVFVGGDAASASVAHSYFLVADGEGNITDSTPRITRQY